MAWPRRSLPSAQRKQQATSSTSSPTWSTMTFPGLGGLALDQPTSASPTVTSRPEPWATLLDFSMRPGRHRSPATMPSYHRGRAPRMELDSTGGGAAFPQKQEATWDLIALGRTPTARPFRQRPAHRRGRREVLLSLRCGRLRRRPRDASSSSRLACESRGLGMRCRACENGPGRWPGPGACSAVSWGWVAPRWQGRYVPPVGASQG
jgi:hypothetical protein